MPYKPLIQYIQQIKALENAGFDTAAVVMVYIGIDMMCLLSLPAGENKQTRRHFKEWVDEFMTGHPDQPYQYDSDDIYAARCSMLHCYGSEADTHNENPEIKIIGYHDGGKHSHDPNIDPRLVLLGMKSFINDYVCAVDKFLEKAGNDLDLKQRIESRLDKVLATFPIPQ